MTTFSADIALLFESDLNDIAGGSLTEFKQITGLTESYQNRIVITNTSVDNFNVVTMWQSGDAGVDDFDFLYVENLNTTAGEDLTLGLTRDRAGTPGHANLIVPAGHRLFLPAGSLTTADLTDGTIETADLIDQIRFKNDITGAVADVSIAARLVLLT